MNAAELWGIARSLCIYYLPLRQRRLRRFYAQFIQPGDLCFDVGAHVGNRVRAFSALGARVVALEPNPALAALLRRHYHSDAVTVLELGASSSSGRTALHLSLRTPTVSSVSSTWIDEVRRDPSFAPVVWDRSVDIELVTLDALIERYGEPAFCKIDVEGHELDVLCGLSRAVRGLSFEYLPISVERAQDCVERVRCLGCYRFNWCEGETMRLCSDTWVSANEVIDMLDNLRNSSRSGDIYAVREDALARHGDASSIER